MAARFRWSVWTILVCLASVPFAFAQTGKKEVHRRAKLPEFDRQQVTRVFFDDVFSWLVGERPKYDAGKRIGAPTAPVAGSPKVPAEPGPGSGAGTGWPSIISATTIEDEIKSTKLEVDKVVTTPSSFAGRGHKAARQSFSLLAMLFAIIGDYEGDVRWKDSAAVARDRFSRTAANVKAGGSIQVYNEAKKRKQDLDDLVRGSRLPGDGAEEMDWANVADRSPLMQLLESRIEANLKQWTSNKAEFSRNGEQLVHEAELAAAIATVLVQDSMDDADDEEYSAFADTLKRGALGIVHAVKSQDSQAAERAMADVKRSCTDCHENYR